MNLATLTPEPMWSFCHITTTLTAIPTPTFVKSEARDLRRLENCHAVGADCLVWVFSFISSSFQLVLPFCYLLIDGKRQNIIFTILARKMGNEPKGDKISYLIWYVDCFWTPVLPSVTYTHTLLIFFLHCGLLSPGLICWLILLPQPINVEFHKVQSYPTSLCTLVPFPWRSQGHP